MKMNDVAVRASREFINVFFAYPPYHPFVEDYPEYMTLYSEPHINLSICSYQYTFQLSGCVCKLTEPITKH